MKSKQNSFKKLGVLNNVFKPNLVQTHSLFKVYNILASRHFYMALELGHRNNGI